jgi:hypothetical protein
MAASSPWRPSEWGTLGVILVTTGRLPAAFAWQSGEHLPGWRSAPGRTRVGRLETGPMGEGHDKCRIN